MARRILVLEDKPTLLHGGQERSLFELISSLHKEIPFVLAYKEPGELLSRYAEYGVETILFPKRLIPVRAPWRLLSDRKEAIRLLKESHAGAVYVNQYFDLPLVQWAAKSLKIPVVCHLRLAAPHYVSRQYNWALKHCSLLIANSQFTRQSWVNAGYGASKITVIPNGIDTAYYAAQGLPKPIADDPVTLVYAGRLSREKGTAFLLDVFSTLCETQRHQAYRLVLIGAERGADAPQGWLKEAITSLPQQVRDLIAVYPPQADVRQWIESADLVLFPTLVPESFGRIFVESLAMRTPVLASHTGALPEIAGPFSSLLVKEGDTIAWVEAIVQHALLKRTGDPLAEVRATYVAATFGNAQYLSRMKQVFLEL
jgi:glycosyltransferase involved in cell wall biosynthesis